MKQLPEQAQKLVDDFKKNLGAMHPEERAVAINQMTEITASMNQDMKGMIGVLQTAKDKREVEELKTKMQIE